MAKNKYRKQRIIYLLLGAISLSIGSFLLFNAFNKNLVFFYSPTEYFSTLQQNQSFFENKMVRIGGLVKQGSFVQKPNSLEVSFYITDLSKAVKVSYTGLLPPIFREGQGIVAEGKFGDNNIFLAKKLITKHDEKYMPPEIKRALEIKETNVSN
jgi:cytochrome c-type biogenesis protein CcmE